MANKVYVISAISNNFSAYASDFVDGPFKAFSNKEAAKKFINDHKEDYSEAYIT